MSSVIWWHTVRESLSLCLKTDNLIVIRSRMYFFWFTMPNSQHLYMYSFSRLDSPFPVVLSPHAKAIPHIWWALLPFSVPFLTLLDPLKIVQKKGKSWNNMQYSRCRGTLGFYWVYYCLLFLFCFFINVLDPYAVHKLHFQCWFMPPPFFYYYLFFCSDCKHCSVCR